MATPIPPNRAAFTLGEIAAATGGRLVDAAPERPVAGVSTDSRTVPADGLFVALWVEPGGPIQVGRDGHEFVPAARARGAFPLVASGRGVEGPRVEVPDTLRALGDLAARYVARETQGHPVPCLAIGGAVGKTTTRALAAAAVEVLFGPTLVTPGSLNNLLGVPLVLLTLAPEHAAMVIECGTSTHGEIPRLGEIVRPEVALVLNADIEHSAGLGGLAAIAEEEASLFAAARRAAVTSSEEPELVERLGRRTGVESLTFGEAPRADLRVERREADPSGGTRVALGLAARFLDRGADRRLEISTPLLGPAAAINLAAALAGALALRDRPLSQEELMAVGRALAAVPPVPGRLAPRPAGSILVLDDSYNANPRSVRVALATARELAAARGGRLVVALGDMLELGELSAAAHRDALGAVAQAGAALLLAVGPQLARAAHEVPLSFDVLLAADAADPARHLHTLLGPGDLVLVKGSRGMGMERIVDALLTAAP